MLPLAQAQADTTVIAAFAVGFISFVSPCVLPLVPGYLSAVSGVSITDMRSGDHRLSAILWPAAIFCLSFTIMFVALGMTATGIGSALRDSKQTLDKIAGIVILAMGVFFLLTPFVPRLNREWRPDALISRAGDRRAGVRDRLDAVRRADARLDPRRGVDLRARRPRRRAARLLLGRPGGAVPAHRRRLRPRDDGLPLDPHPLHAGHGGLRRRARAHGRAHADGRADPPEHR